MKSVASSIVSIRYCVIQKMLKEILVPEYYWADDNMYFNLIAPSIRYAIEKIND